MSGSTSTITFCISPQGRPFVEEDLRDGPGEAVEAGVARRIKAAFETGAVHGLLHLGTSELHTPLPPAFEYAREFVRTYLSRLCRTPNAGAADAPAAEAGTAPAPGPDELADTVLRAPPMKGLEYLNADVLADWWAQLDAHVHAEAHEHPGGTQAYLCTLNPAWRLVGRVTFHLAENKRDAEYPFAFMATYAGRLSAQGRPQHLPLGRALQEYGGAKDRAALLSLLTPIHRAAETTALAKALVESGDVYRALAWTPRQAYGFLREVPALEAAGLIVRVPDWWRQDRPPRPQVSVKIGEAAKSRLGADALLDFSVGVTLGGEPLTEAELHELLQSSGGLVPLRGKWVEVDRERLDAALAHWKHVEREARSGGLSFFDGMRLLAGAALGDGAAAHVPEPVREWSGVVAGASLERALAGLRDPQAHADGAAPPGLLGELRPYQRTGLQWLRFVTRLGLGACLADDMGLGKTVQVLALLLDRRHDRRHAHAGGAVAGDPAVPSLLVVPASLIANWKSEIERFAPSLAVSVIHPSEARGPRPAAETPDEPALDGVDLAITTYGMVARQEWLRRRRWDLVILDEAQAIKNSGARQTRAVKDLAAAGRIALTGTPVENRLSDLWSLFDFLNPGLLGGPKAFSTFVKGLSNDEGTRYAPLRSLVRPYILRRLKTDKRVIADLPEKTEVRAFCGLSKRQAALYEQSVRELGQKLGESDGIERRGVVLAYLMRLKQICNHPSQWTGDGAWDPEHSGKFHRLRELCEGLAQRQERALVFTQFREAAGPLAEFLAGVFGRGGLVLHGGTPVGKRRELVERFQRDDGPPFFVLSLKAGGTGLNLTAASHVIHFDRWWNPAVENQATDRAFRIGQRRNVLVHKFVCRGTVEDRIDELIAEKTGLSRDVLEAGAERALTEMSDNELMRFVALDVRTASGALSSEQAVG